MLLSEESLLSSFRHIQLLYVERQTNRNSFVIAFILPFQSWFQFVRFSFLYCAPYLNLVPMKIFLQKVTHRKPTSTEQGSKTNYFEQYGTVQPSSHAEDGSVRRRDPHACSTKLHELIALGRSLNLRRINCCRQLPKCGAAGEQLAISWLENFTVRAMAARSGHEKHFMNIPHRIANLFCTRRGARSMLQGKLQLTMTVPWNAVITGMGEVSTYNRKQSRSAGEQTEMFCLIM